VICGVDEAGLRSLAGPAVACAAILPLNGLSTRLLGALDDSKRLSPEVRGGRRQAAGQGDLGEASAVEIDRFNILRAQSRAPSVRAVTPAPPLPLPAPPHLLG
jgi:ribonuclease HII